MKSIIVTLPIKISKSNHNGCDSYIITDSKDVEYFFNEKEGKLIYDGFCRPVLKKESTVHCDHNNQNDDIKTAEIEIIELGYPQSIIQIKNNPTTEIISTELLMNTLPEMSLGKSNDCK